MVMVNAVTDREASLTVACTNGEYSVNRIATPITGMSASGFVVAGGAAVIVIDYILDHLGLDPNWREIIEDMTPDQVSEIQFRLFWPLDEAR